MTNPLVSVIIPVYNAEKYIAEAITSVINQTWPNIEIIIIDDGSTDRSLEIAKAFSGEKIKVYTQPNQGATVARNYGLKESRGDYIQFLDADDLLSSDKIEGQVLRLNGSLTHVCVCNTIHFTDGENHLDIPITHEWFAEESDNPVDFLLKLYAGDEVMPGYGGMIQPNAWLTPKNLIEKAGPWKEFKCPDDDGEFFCRVLLASDGVKFSSKGLNYYRKFKHQQSLSGQRDHTAVKNIVLAIDLKYSNLKASTNDPIVDTIFARHYWWTGVNIYPQFKTLSQQCINKAKQLGYKGTKYIGGNAGHTIAKFFGWKTARLLSYYKHR